jgi:hypothetical protein
MTKNEVRLMDFSSNWSEIDHGAVNAMVCAGQAVVVGSALGTLQIDRLAFLAGPGRTKHKGMSSAGRSHSLIDEHSVDLPVAMR